MISRTCDDCCFCGEARCSVSDKPICTGREVVCDAFTWSDGRLRALECLEKRLMELCEYRNGAAIMAMELLELMEANE